MADREQNNSSSDVIPAQAESAAVTPERWQHIKQLFIAALELSPAERGSFLLQACGPDELLRVEVESLLVEEQAEMVSAPVTSENGLENEDKMIGRRLGAYEIVRQIGRGGMATVYLAVRADDQYRKQVAIKLVSPEFASPEVFRRFRNERQTLAGLDHPNIVKLLDGGTVADGIPYLVMDYVEGASINAYCDSLKLSTTERLRLFRLVCAGVEYAHQHGVIHRDLKPSNILVTPDGIPKLLDFGIAKLLNPELSSATLQLTQSGMRQLTPAYASPEQIRGEPINYASDVYSLGVVLFELLTGHRPYRLKRYTPMEIERVICETDPERPSTAVSRVEMETALDGTTSSTITPEVVSQTRDGEPRKLKRRLRGDLDNIVLMALHKDPQRRYRSVEEFSADIARHLEQRPIKARRSTLTYRVSRFISRHKIEAMGAALILVLIVGGILLVRWEGRRAAEQARSQFQGQAVKARRSVAVLGFKNVSSQSEMAWLSTALSQMLTADLAAGEKLRTIPQENVAQMKINLGLPEVEALSPAALARVRKNLSTDLIVVGSYLDLGKASGGQIHLALRVQDAGLGETIAEEAEEGTEADLLGMVTRAGSHLRQKLGLEEASPAEVAAASAALPSNPLAERLYAEGLQVRAFDALAARALFEKAVAEDPTSALIHSALAECWSTLGYDSKSQEEAKTAVDLSTNLSREQRLRVEGTYRQTTKEWDKAINAYQTLFSLFPDSLDDGIRLAATQASAGRGKDALTTLEALKRLPSPMREDARIDLAEAEAAMALTDYKHQAAAAGEAARKGQAEGARQLVARARVTEGLALRGMGDLKGAMAASYEARQLFVSANDRYGESRALHNMGAVYFDQGDLNHAQKAFFEAARIRRQIGNKAGEAKELNNIAVVLAHKKDVEGAKRAYLQSLKVSRELGDRTQVGLVLNNIGVLEKDQGRFVDAKRHYQEALALDREVGNQSEIARVLSNISVLFIANGDLAAARKNLEECLQISRQIGDKNGIGVALANLAETRFDLGDIEQALLLYSEALRLFSQTGNQNYASYALFGLGNILAAKDDLAGSRKKHEEALALRDKAGERGDIASSHLALAELSLEEGHLSDAETVARQVAADFRIQADVDDQAKAEILLARCLLVQQKFTDAQNAIHAARKLLAKSRDRGAQITIAIADARVRATLGNTAEAVTLLEKVMHDAQRAGFVGLQFETSFALGEIEMQAGKVVVGRTRLEALEKDANAKGFGLIAHKARSAIKRS